MGLRVLILVCVAWYVTDAAIIRAAKPPFVLNLRRVEPVPGNATAPRTYREVKGDKSVRSRSVLFENALGVTGGLPYTFDITKWRLLQASGLFANLTAKTLSKNGEVMTIISGDELPSIQFAPEVAVGAKSIDKPEVSGNLMFRDNNFRGMGDRVELLVRTFSRGVDSKAADLPPTIRFKWLDSIRGRPSSVSVSVEEDHTLEDTLSVVPPAVGGTALCGAGVPERIQLACSQLFVTLQGIHRPRQQASSPLAITQSKYEIEPYIKSTSASAELPGGGGDSRLSGARFKLASILKGGEAVDLAADVGVLKSKTTGYSSKFPFQQLSLLATTREVPLLRGLRFTLPSPSPQSNTSSSSATSTQTQTSTPELTLTGQIKARVMESRGDGCLPLMHFAAIEDPSYLRGFADSTILPRVPKLAVLKADAYFHGWAQAVPGLFIDAGVFTALQKQRTVSVGGGGFSWFSAAGAWLPAWLGGSTGAGGAGAAGGVVPVLRKQITLGLSLRARGFRLDMGWPCSEALPKFYFAIDQ